MNSIATAALVAALVSTVVGHARAEVAVDDRAPAPSSWQESVTQASANGSFLPLTLTPSVGPNRAQAAGFGGYDSANEAAVVETFAEVRVIGPVALRLGAALKDGQEELGPSIGARAQLLSQARQGVDGAVALFYKAEGFTEAEGEIEAVLSVGGRVGRTLIVGNLAYGQDGEGNERDGELRAATLVRLSRWAMLGVDARARFDLGSREAKLRANNEPTYDLDAGPVATIALGPVALGAHAGVSVVRRIDQQAELGATVLAGLGTAF